LTAEGGQNDGKEHTEKVEKKKKEKKKKEKNEGEPTQTMPSMEEMLKKYDTDGSISNLIEMERETPELMLDPDELKQVQTGAVEIRCDVCRAVSTIALRRAKKAKALRSEDALSDMVANLCVGTPATSDEYPKYPGNPPLWGELYTVSRDAEGRWQMRRLPKGSAKEEKGGGIAGGDVYNRMVIKHSMISRACKQIVHEGEHDLAELIFSTPQASPEELAAKYCAAECPGEEVAPAKDEM